MKKLILAVTEEYGEGGIGYGVPTQQDVYSETDKGTVIEFRVCNLDECPENAIICRNLFNAEDFIKVLKLGMQLAKEGYTDLEIEYI